MNRPEEGRSVKVRSVSEKNARRHDSDEEIDAWTKWKKAKNVNERPMEKKARDERQAEDG